MKSAHVPVRTCIGCGEGFPQADLIRIKLSGGKLTICPEGSGLAGRSVYLCAKESCWNKALRKGSIVFKSAKHRRLVLSLDAKEKDHFIFQLKKFVNRYLKTSNA